MGADNSGRFNLLDQLAEEFAQRFRRGERPSLQEYVTRHPDLANDIRDLFPALAAVEQAEANRLKPGLLESEGSAPPLRQVGDYQIVRKLGAGGMGVVYEAEQLSLRRRVALKVLSAQVLGDDRARERFRREARSAAQLHHTNIVPVFEVGQIEDVCYYAMQFIPGQSLDQVIRELRRLRDDTKGPPTVSAASTAPAAAAAANPSEALSAAANALLTGHFKLSARATDVGKSGAGSDSVPLAVDAASGSTSPRSTLSGVHAGQWPYYRSVARLGEQTAHALAHAHARGIIHRDIKPSNLLLDESGVVWITDFGLAKTEEENLTGTGDLPGTLRYMAPERFAGQADARADIYALGLTLYELLVLRPAFAVTDRVQLLEQILKQQPPRPRALDPRLPRDLETVVLKAIDKDARRRYQSADLLAEDLRRFLHDEPIRARRAPWHEQTWRWCRRNPGWAALFVVSLILLTVIAVGGAVLNVHLSAALAQSRQAELDRKRQLLDSLILEARAQRFSGRAGQRFGSLESIRKATDLAHELQMPASTYDELRNLAIAALALADIHQVRELEAWPEGTEPRTYDDQLERYARSDKVGNITVRRLADDRELAQLVAPLGQRGGYGLLGFEPDGKVAVVRDPRDGALKRWRFGGAALEPYDGAPFQTAKYCDSSWGVGYTADRRLVIDIDVARGTVGVYRLPSGERLHEIRLARPAKPTAERPAWVFVDMHPWRHELALSMGPDLDPERELVRILDLDRGTVLAELPRGPWGYTTGNPGWYPDGNTLAVGYAQGVVVWDVPSRKVIHQFTGHHGGGLRIWVSRSGQIMATTGWAGGVKLWHPQTEKLVLSMPSRTLNFTRITSDGRLFASDTEGNHVRLWSAEPSPVHRVFVRDPMHGPVAEYRRSSVHRDGRLLAVGTSEGVSLFDLANSVDVGYLNIGYTLSVQFDPTSGDLLTLGTLGLLRWPVRCEPANPVRLHVGPPKRLLQTPAADNEFRISRDGRTIAVAQFTRVTVLLADQPDRPVVLKPTVAVRQQISISPDGQWVATGSFAGGDVHVWEARTGRLVKSLPFNSRCIAQFTPDGQRLLVGAPGYIHFWRVGTWDEMEIPATLRQINFDVGPMPEFSPDGNLLAWEPGNGALRLIDVATGLELAELENPNQGRSDYITFTADSTQLIARNLDSSTLQVWDLRELRKRLKDLDLDWDAQPYPSATEEHPVRPLFPPLQLAIDNPFGRIAGQREDKERE
jgi:WD40 repeat protein